jgi:hypothetical protein
MKSDKYKQGHYPNAKNLQGQRHYPDLRNQPMPYDEPPRFAELRSGKMVEQPHGIDWMAIAICLAAIAFCLWVWYCILFSAVPAIWNAIF